MRTSSSFVFSFLSLSSFLSSSLPSTQLCILSHSVVTDTNDILSHSVVTDTNDILSHLVATDINYTAALAPRREMAV